ncbi:3-dehydroquinate synthase [Alkalicoccus halolimnae]|uniref:3-dehydroquinate synthase n=1 Tax=Alkalicoccus halolimnae TaxID=1667239 RepID=A0A5C7FFA6_9BACI|nr:3-dehydroquinate synthase [Alkalicoccus halolimnae]TXF83004.1 3-dehydroquinate synthase [Alkalicoccus halolimnae]
MSERIEVESDSHSYPVLLENGLRYSFYHLLEDILPDHTKLMIIADETAASYYLEDLLASFPDSAKPVVTILPSGETSKSMVQYERLLTECLQEGLDRKSVIAALGGGVAGDIAGFTAATYMRGIRYVQIPTTLLAHDSSVGGKTGINHPLGKNMIGAFHAPSAVLYDPEMLISLPEKEWRSGFAEVIKHAFISSPEFFVWLQNHVHKLSSVDPSTLEKMLKKSIETKVAVVQEDEREAGVRAHLNFGHTLGHAIEAELGYGKTTHGEAVAVGMIFAMRLSEKFYGIKLPIEETVKYLEKLGYYLKLQKQVNAEKLLFIMKRDKKASGGSMRFVLLPELGRAELVDIREEMVLDLLEEEELT